MTKPKVIDKQVLSFCIKKIEMNKELTFIEQMKDRGYSETQISAIIRRHKREGMPSRPASELPELAKQLILNELIEELKKQGHYDEKRPIPAFGRSGEVLTRDNG